MKRSVFLLACLIPMLVACADAPPEGMGQAPPEGEPVTYQPKDPPILEPGQEKSTLENKREQ